MGGFVIRGITNKDLQRVLFPQPATDSRETNRRAALVSRKLRLLQAHGIIRKVPGRSLYQVPASGRLFLNAFLMVVSYTFRTLPS
jgi:hypothetical protein